MTYFTDSEELRQLGRMFGVADPNAGHEAIGDAITSRVETLQTALRNLVAWKAAVEVVAPELGGLISAMHAGQAALDGAVSAQAHD